MITPTLFVAYSNEHDKVVSKELPSNPESFISEMETLAAWKYPGARIDWTSAQRSLFEAIAQCGDLECVMYQHTKKYFESQEIARIWQDNPELTKWDYIRAFCCCCCVEVKLGEVKELYGDPELKSVTYSYKPSLHPAYISNPITPALRGYKKLAKCLHPRSGINMPIFLANRHEGALSELLPNVVTYTALQFYEDPLQAEDMPIENKMLVFNDLVFQVLSNTLDFLNGKIEAVDLRKCKFSVWDAKTFAKVTAVVLMGLKKNSNFRILLNNSEQLYHLGYVLSLKKCYRVAIDCFSQSLALNPHNFSSKFSYIFRAIAYGRSGQKQQAIKDFQEALRIDPNIWNASHDDVVVSKELEDDAQICGYFAEARSLLV